jgi:toxin ParE1/3/4
MSLLVSFHRSARAEFIDAAAWYEARRHNLGIEFVAEIERCIALAAENPMHGVVAHNGIRRIVAERFPYGVYFLPEPRRIVVLAVFHFKRNPSVLRQRVK